MQQWLMDYLPKVARPTVRECGLELPPEQGLWDCKLPFVDLLRNVCFDERDATKQLEKDKSRYQTLQRKYDTMQESITKKLDRKTKRAAKTVEELTKTSLLSEEDIQKTKEMHLARRNQYSRKYKQVKKHKKNREDLEKELPPIRETRPRLTIFEKLQVVDYAKGLLKDQPILKKARTRLTKKTMVRQRFKAGMNLQRLCELKFGDRFGKIKVCQLLRAARKQEWEKLSVSDQKRYFHLPDKVKVEFGQGHLVRGWKSLSGQAIADRLDKTGSLSRWDVPGPVLKASG